MKNRNRFAVSVLSIQLFMLVMGWRVSAAESPGQVLRRLQAERLPGHPLVEAARRRLEQAQADAEGADGYFDTRFQATAGYARWARPLPGSLLNTGIGVNQTSLEAGLTQALWPGVFLAAGAAEREHDRTGSPDARFQTLAGIQVSIPLLQNRGHAQWRWERRQARAAVEAARAQLRAVLEQLRLESELAWIELHQVVADAAAYRLAGRRVDTLLAETETLVRLQAVPEYQLYPSRLDHALRAEEILMAEQRVDVVRERLRALLGDLPPLPPPDALPAWAEQRMDAGADPDDGLSGALARSGLTTLWRARQQEAQAAEARARDAARPDLRLTLGASWQVEDPDDPFGGEALLDGEEAGVEASLVLDIPFQRRRERAVIRAAAARVDESGAQIAHETRLLNARLADARQAVSVARQRMEQVESAVENARRTLDAESERFRLGEGRSRNVLDAQKDLTAAELRRHAAAAALLQAMAALDFAAAYPGGILSGTDADTAARELMNLLNPQEIP